MSILFLWCFANHVVGSLRHARPPLCADMQFHSVGRAAVGPSRAMTRRLQQAAQWMERALLAITVGVLTVATVVVGILLAVWILL